jgi:hypothetical protein
MFSRSSAIIMPLSKRFDAVENGDPDMAGQMRGPLDLFVSSCRQPWTTIDFLLSAKRDAEATKRFFRKALAQPHTVNHAPSPWTRTRPIPKPLRR